MPLMLTIVNDGTCNGALSNYEWTMWLVPHGDLNKMEKIDSGRVEGYSNGDGWRALVARISAVRAVSVA